MSSRLQGRGKKEFDTMPLVMISGNSFEKNSARARELGATDYMAKPQKIRICRRIDTANLTFADFEQNENFSGSEFCFCGDFGGWRCGKACGKTWSMDRRLIWVSGWWHVFEGA